MLYNIIHLNKIPDVAFAHIYQRTGYKVQFKQMEANIEIAYIKAGALVLECDGRQYDIPEGSFVVIPHKYAFTIKTLNNKPHIHYTVSAMIDKDATLKKGISDITDDALHIPMVIEPYSKSSQLSEMLRHIIREFQNGDPISQRLCGAMTAELICELARSDNSRRNSGMSNGAEILDMRIKKYIAKTLSSKITLSELSASLDKNPNYLNQIFKKKNGMSIISYVNLLKVQKVGMLITEQNLSLKEAARQVGIDDVNYMSRMFKSKMGMTVSEFKANSAYNTFPLNDWKKIYKEQKGRD